MTKTEQPNNGQVHVNSVAADHAIDTQHVDAPPLPADAPPGDDVVIPQPIDADLPGDQYLLAISAVSHDALGTVDYALHQLTTATDLFDVPVIDFHDHGFGT